MKLMTSKMGRPKVEKPKAFQISVKMDADTLKKLDALSDQYGESRGSVMRKGIERLYAETKK
ncbi:MAG: ribbon-helix-helix protein, CopG family [Oscillospiraceae bacterium]|nr:ribbon-helix-helix protein, CopG family [Oscillospiraceae bacterium]